MQSSSLTKLFLAAAIGVLLTNSGQIYAQSESGHSRTSAYGDEAACACYGNDAVTLNNSASCPQCGLTCCGQGSSLIPCQYKRLNRFYVDGWLSVGATSFAQPPITTSSITTSTEPFNEEASSVEMNQFYLIMGIEPDKCRGLSVGGRVDLLYGTDYLYTSAIGLETKRYTAQGFPAETPYNAGTKWNRSASGGRPEYGIALPQAYAEFYAPMMDGLSVKVGHYYSPVGYESVMSPSNFFYSHSYSMLYGEAQTLTGVLATLKMNQNWSVIGGADQGWNTWDDAMDDVSWLAGLKWANDYRTSSLSFTLMSGKQLVDATYAGAENWNLLKGDLTNYSLVYQQKLTPSLQYVLQHDLGIVTDGSYWYNNRYQKQLEDGHWYSLVNYLFYQLSDTLAVGGRFEWFNDEGNTRYYSGPTAIGNRFLVRGDNYYNMTLGLNWKPTPWITIRPEVRYDWSDFEIVDPQSGSVLGNGAYDHLSKKDVVSVNGDVIIRF